MSKEKIKEYMIMVVLFLAMIAFLATISNQLSAFMYKQKLVSDPCRVCAEKGPHLANCLGYPDLWTFNASNITWIRNQSFDVGK